MRVVVLGIGCMVLAGCESVIGLSDLEFDRSGDSGASTGATTSGDTTGTTTGAEGSGSTATSSTATSGTTGGGEGGAGGHGGGGQGGGGGPAAVTYPDLVRQDGPSAYWRLGEPSSELLARDDGGAHDGVYFNGDGGEYILGEPGAIAGDPDTAASFQNGGHMLVENAGPFRFVDQAPLTIELWMKLDLTGADGHTPIQCHGGDPSAGWIMYVGDDSFYWKRYGTTNDEEPASQGSSDSTVPTDGGAFHHIVITMDGEGFITSYVDGTITVLDEPSPIFISEHDEPLLLGLHNYDPASRLVTLDEVALYDHPLTPDRVGLHFQCGRFGFCD